MTKQKRSLSPKAAFAKLSPEAQEQLSQFWRTAAARFGKSSRQQLAEFWRDVGAKFKPKPKLIRWKKNPRKQRKAKRNPQVLTIGNPGRAELSKAVAAYKEFHGVNPASARKIGKGKGVLVALGELVEITYKPRRGERKGTAWFHRFRKGAVLAGTPDGKKLYIVDREGGRKAVDWSRGIIR